MWMRLSSHALLMPINASQKGNFRKIFHPTSSFYFRLQIKSQSRISPITISSFPIPPNQEVSYPSSKYNNKNNKSNNCPSNLWLRMTIESFISSNDEPSKISLQEIIFRRFLHPLDHVTEQNVIIVAVVAIDGVKFRHREQVMQKQ